jgi:6-phosphogluconolactonase/glucosamine-6-phosphate isomerase/deaminase
MVNYKTLRSYQKENNETHSVWCKSDDYGKEYYMTVLTTKDYSLLQVAFDMVNMGIGSNGHTLQISMGYGRYSIIPILSWKVGIYF